MIILKPFLILICRFLLLQPQDLFSHMKIIRKASTRKRRRRRTTTTLTSLISHFRHNHQEFLLRQQQQQTVLSCSHRFVPQQLHLQIPFYFHLCVSSNFKMFFVCSGNSSKQQHSSSNCILQWTRAKERRGRLQLEKVRTETSERERESSELL